MFTRIESERALSKLLHVIKHVTVLPWHSLAKFFLQRKLIGERHLWITHYHQELSDPALA